jgi:hypothetical protein
VVGGEVVVEGRERVVGLLRGHHDAKDPRSSQERFGLDR